MNVPDRKKSKALALLEQADSLANEASRLATQISELEAKRDAAACDEKLHAEHHSALLKVQAEYAAIVSRVQGMRGLAEQQAGPDREKILSFLQDRAERIAGQFREHGPMASEARIALEATREIRLREVEAAAERFRWRSQRAKEHYAAAQRVHSIRDLYDAVEACIAADEAHDCRVQSNVDDQKAAAEIEDRIALELLQLASRNSHANPGGPPDNQPGVKRRSKASDLFAAVSAEHRRIENEWSAAQNRADALLRRRDGADAEA